MKLIPTGGSGRPPAGGEHGLTLDQPAADTGKGDDVIALLFGSMTAVLVLVVIAQAHLQAFQWAKPQRSGSAPEVFRCKLRLDGEPRWPRRKGCAAWVHDVLIVRTGHLYPRIAALAVRLPEDRIREASPTEISGLGRHPVVITVRLDDGQLIDIATTEQNRSLLVGPFCAAAIPGLRGGRVERLPGRTLGPSRRSDPKNRD